MIEDYGPLILAMELAGSFALIVFMMRRAKKYSGKKNYLWGDQVRDYSAPKTDAAFVSYYSAESSPKAALIHSLLEAHGLKVIPLGGEAICPYPKNSPDEARWLLSSLSKQIARTWFLTFVASPRAFSSRWVRLELNSAAGTAKAIFVLWTEGPDPRTQIQSYMTFAPRYLPLKWILLNSNSRPPGYIVDLRSNLPDRLAIFSEVLESVDDMNVEYQKRKLLVPLFWIIMFVSLGLSDLSTVAWLSGWAFGLIFLFLYVLRTVPCIADLPKRYSHIPWISRI